MTFHSLWEKSEVFPLCTAFYTGMRPFYGNIRLLFISILSSSFFFCYYLAVNADMAELVDAVDSKSAGSNPFRVRFSMSVFFIAKKTEKNARAIRPSHKDSYIRWYSSSKSCITVPFVFSIAFFSTSLSMNGNFTS